MKDKRRYTKRKRKTKRGSRSRNKVPRKYIGGSSKIDEMTNIINFGVSNAHKNMERKNESSCVIDLRYKDICYTLYVIECGTEESYKICSVDLARKHFIRQRPECRECGFAPANESDSASEPGDGALFVALVVLRINDKFKNITQWEGGVSAWWRREENICCGIDTGRCRCINDASCIHKKGCINSDLDDACVQVVDSSRYEIDNSKFLIWAKGIIESHTSEYGNTHGE
jgi:hypothetical protein